MINYWWVTRPKRKLNSIPESLTTFISVTLNNEWLGQRSTHLTLEEALEKANLKRKGERRDQTGGGGRTYKAWYASLGLIFIQNSTKQIKLTLAGEAIIAGESPVQILKNQVLKYQFPSSYSLGRGVNVSSRFKIRPFKFLLRLLFDNDIGYLTQEEIAKVVIIKGENESEHCYSAVKKSLLNFRTYGDSSLENDFFSKYAPKSGIVNIAHPFSHLEDTANTFINWLEYTQLAIRDEESKLKIVVDMRNEVEELLNHTIPLIDRPEDHEYFQRKYGIDPKHKKDTRNLAESATITTTMIAEQSIKQAFIIESMNSPLSKMTPALISKISDKSGYHLNLVEEVLYKNYPYGAIGSFMAGYFEMAFKGRDNAIDFERATASIFTEVFGMRSKHVGPIGLSPDVVVLSDEEGFTGIIDNKAYHTYSITNDHKNRMIYNYIPAYSNGKYPLAFFTYISGGFGKNIDAQVKDIVDLSNVHGSAISVANMIKFTELYSKNKMNHLNIKELFSTDKQIVHTDLI